MLTEHPHSYNSNWIALQRETESAERMMTLGFSFLERANFLHQEFYYTAFFNVTIAIERICKLIIDSNEYKDTGKFMTDGQLSQLGHKLIDLYKRVNSIIKSLNNANPPQPPENKNAVTEILKRLTDFAQNGRYYNFVRLTKSGAADPIKQWIKTIQEFKPQGILSSEQNIYLEKAKGMDTATRALADIFHCDEEGKTIQSYEQYTNALFKDEHIQLEGCCLLYSIVKYLASCLSAFSNIEYPPKDSSSRNPIIDDSLSVDERLQIFESARAKVPEFQLPNYNEFFIYFQKTNEQYREYIQRHIKANTEELLSFLYI